MDIKGAEDQWLLIYPMVLEVESRRVKSAHTIVLIVRPSAVLSHGLLLR